jgi:Tol biopolymer transport system component
MRGSDFETLSKVVQARRYVRFAVAAFALFVALFGLVSSGRPASGSFPGRNGEIAFTRSTQCRLVGGEPDCVQTIWVANLDGSGERRLTGQPDASVPVWSPDGRRILYAWRTGPQGFNELWLMRADGGGKRKVWGASVGRSDVGLGRVGVGDSDYVPSWSPDGKTFLLPGGVGKPPDTWAAVWSLSADGRGAKVLFRNTRKVKVTCGGSEFLKPSFAYPHWSPKGGRIAFLSLRKATIKERGEKPCVSTETWLWVSRPDGSDRKAIARAHGGEGDRPFDWSPDGRRIVFLRSPALAPEGWPEGDPEVYVVNADGTGLRRLTYHDHMFLQPFHTPLWSPDGGTILFKTNNLELNGQFVDAKERFVAMNPDGSGLRLVGPRPGCVSGELEGQKQGCGAWEPSWRSR